jgi:hypothetical protein
LGIGLAAVVIGAAYLGVRASDEWRQQRIGDEALRSARESAIRAREIVTVQNESVALMGQNAVVNSRLIVALRGRVDSGTLTDVFAGEAWWEPYRHLLSAISYEGTEIAFSHGAEVEALPLAEMVGQVRATRSQQSRFVAAAGHAYVVAATPMHFGAGLEDAILVLARPFDKTVFSAIATRAGAPLLLSDGRVALVHTGAEADVRLLAAGIGREKDGGFTLQDTAWGAAAVEVTPGIWLWAGSRVNPLARAQAARHDTRVKVLAGSAGALSLLFLVLSLLRRPPDAQATPVQTLPAREDGAPSLPMAGTASFPAVAMRNPASGQGTPLGRYMLLDRIGEGGMAEVFTAVSFGSSGFRRSFVIKRLRPEMASSPMAVAHFIDEANLASTLVHPNVVPVFDFGEVGGSYFLAQEYIVGRDLGRLTRKMVEKNLPALSVGTALFIAHEVLRGLHYAHEKRADDGSPLDLVHRDVTPENVMISERGEIKVLDFGIVKSAQRLAQTDIGIVKGNVDFMAPEQARGRPVDRRADVFSVGLVLYFAVARKPLYQGDTLFDRLTRAAMGPGEAELAAIAALPAPLPELLTSALATEVDQRFESAAAFAQAIAVHGFGGAAELTGVMNVLFGDELALEQDRLAAAFPRGRRESDMLLEREGNKG